MSINKIICLILFHRIHVVQEFGGNARKVHCDRCDRYFAMHDGYQAFVEWDKDIEELYADHYGYGRTIK